MTDASLVDVPSAESTTRPVDDVTLHVVAAGDPENPLVVLLHGFPDFWYGWREQIGPLVDAGYRVLAPDMRGYNRSDAPAGVESYRTPRLSYDVKRLIASEGRERAHVVGHDWGAFVAWDLALRCPEVVDHLGIVNVPHPTVFRRTLRSSPRQMARSWYAAAFQIPWLPERLLGSRDGELIASMLEDSANPGAFGPRDLQRYRVSWREGSLAAMLNYYRAVARYRDDPPRTEVAAPTLICWGEQDVALVPEMAERSREFCADGRLERFPEASHWVHLEESDRVTAALRAHLP